MKEGEKSQLDITTTFNTQHHFRVPKLLRVLGKVVEGAPSVDSIAQIGDFIALVDNNSMT